MSRETLRRLVVRARNVPLRSRAPQLVNAAITPLACRPFGLIHVVEHPKCGGTWIYAPDRSWIEHFLMS